MEMRPIPEILRRISLGVENGDSSAVKELASKAIQQNISPEDILNNSLIRGMNVVGKKFKENEVFIPEVLIATRAMKAGMDTIRPYLADQSYTSRGKIIMGTVRGDLHDIGKKVVIVMLEKEGYDIIDLGIDVAKEKFIKGIKKEKPQIVGLSALLTTTMAYMREVIEAVEKDGLRKSVKIIIGGAPITPSYAKEIRADGYAKDAQAAVSLVKHLLSV
jgi:5-methyltetrahydrofolate--homocysteine methyltransferase